MNRWTHLIAAVIMSLVPALARGASSGPTLLSEATWGGPNSDAPNGVAVAADGSSYVVGITDSFTVDQFGQPSASIFILKFGVDGSLTWQRVWTGPTLFGPFQGPAVALAADGSVYVAGTTTNINGGDAFLLKFDGNGNLLWQRTWGGADFDQGAAVAAAADGSAYVVGTTRSFGIPQTLFIVKFAADGTLVWQKLSDFFNGMAAAVGPDGSVYAAGASPRPNTTFSFDIVVQKMTPDGAQVWATAYSAGEIVDARGGMTVAPDGSIYVAGAAQVPVHGFVDIRTLIVKLGPDGSLIWDREWGGSSGDTAAGVSVAPDGTVYITGTTSSFGVGTDAFVVHLLSTGKGKDATTWGGAGFDNGNAVGVAGDGTVVLAAAAQAPPYSFLSAPAKTSMAKGVTATPSGSFSDAAGSVSDPGAAVITPAGSTTFAGSLDAALVRIAP